MITALMKAAEEARRASSVARGNRVVEIVITELGVVVRGSDVVDGKRVAQSGELQWRDLLARPGVLIDCVHLIDEQLARAGSARP